MALGSRAALLSAPVVLIGLLAPAPVTALTDSIFGKRTVAVPHVIQTDPVNAYSALRRAGLRVSIPQSFSLDRVMFVSRQSPAPGFQLPIGAAVTLALSPGPIPSLSVPKRMLRYRIPDFVGRTLAFAVGWLRNDDVSWRGELPPLDASASPSLFAAYQVTAQTPPPGTPLQLGFLRYGAFHLTPVTFRLRARH